MQASQPVQHQKEGEHHTSSLHHNPEYWGYCISFAVKTTEKGPG